MPRTSKRGGARPGSGAKPSLNPYDVTKRVRMTRHEEAWQIAAAVATGKDWSTWSRDLCNAEAARVLPDGPPKKGT